MKDHPHEFPQPVNRGWVRRATLVAACALLLISAGCGGGGPRKAVGRLDTPRHHTLRGHDMVAEGRWDKAERSFDQALSLDAKYGPALAGKAIVMAQRASGEGLSSDEREERAEESVELLDTAVKRGKSDEERLAAHVAGVRVYQLAKPDEDWLEDAESHYEDAVDLDETRSDPSPHFYMARAYRDAFELRKATRLYRRVLSMNRGLTGEADGELELLQKIERAAPGTIHGKAVAFAPSLSRADVAALFVEELRLAQLYSRGSKQRFDTRFKAPQQRQLQTDTLQRMPDATDIKDHPLRVDIEEVMRLKVSGMQPDPSHRFHPDAKISRAEFAIMVQDILVRVTGEQRLKTKFVGQKSPFRDVRADLPYFNAVQTVVTRNLMTLKNKLRGLFGPTDALTGADALLVIRLLKNELKSYLRS